MLIAETINPELFSGLAIQQELGIMVTEQAVLAPMLSDSQAAALEAIFEAMEPDAAALKKKEEPFILPTLPEGMSVLQVEIPRVWAPSSNTAALIRGIIKLSEERLKAIGAERAATCLQ